MVSLLEHLETLTVSHPYLSAALADDPEAQKVREWRHKLQKAFLNKQLPKDEVRSLLLILALFF